MKILLINPPVRDFYATAVRRQPLGLLYIAAALKKAGAEVELLNGHTPKKKIIPLPEEFSYLEKYMQGDKKLPPFPYKNYYHFGMDFTEMGKRIKESNADLYMISSMFTPYYRETLRIIQEVRASHPAAFIAVGGYHASLYPEFFLNETGADFAITGEGEVSAPLLAENIKTKHVERKQIISSPSLDINSLPFPAREMLKKRDFRFYKKRAVSMISSRGCPHACTFCTGRTIWGTSWRPRSIDFVIKEIALCAGTYGAGLVNFEDDNIFPSKTRARALLEGIIHWKESTGTAMEFSVMNGVSLENMDREIISLMKKAGFNEINISLVSQSAETCRLQGRPFTAEKFKEIVTAAKDKGMNVRGYFILGLPGESVADMKETISFMKGLDISFYPSVYYNVESPPSEWMMQRSSAFFNESEKVSRDELMRLFHSCFS